MIGQPPRTAREALLAEVLDEVDSLHRRVLALPDSLVSMEVKLARTVSVLDQAADNFRMAVTAFSEQAKADLLAFHERKTAQASTQILDVQREQIRTLLQENKFSTQLLRPDQLDELVNKIYWHQRRFGWICLSASIIVGIIAPILTANIAFWVLNHL